MYIFEFNDNLRYRTRKSLADELREVAARIESGCSYLPSCKFNNVAGWLHTDQYGEDDEYAEYGEDEEDEEDEFDDFEELDDE